MCCHRQSRWIKCGNCRCACAVSTKPTGPLPHLYYPPRNLTKGNNVFRIVTTHFSNNKLKFWRSSSQQQQVAKYFNIQFKTLKYLSNLIFWQMVVVPSRAQVSRSVWKNVFVSSTSIFISEGRFRVCTLASLHLNIAVILIIKFKSIFVICTRTSRGKYNIVACKNMYPQLKSSIYLGIINSFDAVWKWVIGKST